MEISSNIMSEKQQITTIFLDIGGVLLSNGWDRDARRRAAEIFALDFPEFDERHHLIYDIYEMGKLGLDEYLQQVVFNQDRSFSMDDFKAFMFQCSKPYPKMIAQIRRLRDQYSLRTIAVSNEGRELTEYRIHQFNLYEVVDTFVSSCFVHLRKPDIEIYKLALDISHSYPEQVVYIDDRGMFVEVAKQIGIQSIQHINYQSTYKSLMKLRYK
jgi:putative hydrolase of the HAD superfamily